MTQRLSGRIVRRLCAYTHVPHREGPSPFNNAIRSRGARVLCKTKRLLRPGMKFRNPWPTAQYVIHQAITSRQQPKDFAQTGN